MKEVLGRIVDQKICQIMNQGIGTYIIVGNMKP